LRAQFTTCLGGLLAIAVACSAERAEVPQVGEQAAGGIDGGGQAAMVQTAGAGGERFTPQGGASDDLAFGGAGAAAGGFASIACADETRAVPYEAGLELASEELGLRLTLLESRPSPRVGNLRWTLQVLDAEGETVNGATVKVSPFMPDHHHGSPLVPTVDESGDGVYVASPINLTMPGFWRTTVRVTTDAWTDIVIVPLCIE
jgi:YtkA-like